MEGMTPNVAPIFENSRDMIAAKRALGKSGDPNLQGAWRKVHKGEMIIVFQSKIWIEEHSISCVVGLTSCQLVTCRWSDEWSWRYLIDRQRKIT
ncbi:hypothetical protein [uncultured Cohaesibacter sp.]|uniref:hypothetical protein n=1 Tax=uncultured Cohaesibacter sp. TaxID=1002546 RepID=UPI002AAA74CF|nr:hypothetical protein [uncultured Cohaesibacter sp.]